jgi:hypothetical protein
MSEICRLAQEHGLVVATGGKCAVTCKSAPYNFKHNRNDALNGDWGGCAECEESKVVVAFENFSEGYSYLSEKPFLPLETGALGIYIGNGIDLLQDAGVNVKDKFVFVGSSYDINQAPLIVKAVKDVIMNEEDAIRRMTAPAFIEKTLTTETLNLEKVQEFCTRHPKMKKIRNLEKINVFVGPAYGFVHPFKDPAWMKRMLRTNGKIFHVEDPSQAHIIVENL